MSFFLEIISPERKVYSGEVEKITVPAITGQLTILSKHIPLFTPLDFGEVKIVDVKNKIHYLSISKGMVEVAKNKVILIIEDASFASEIVEKKVLAAKKKAEEILKTKPKEKDLLTATQALRRSLIDLKIIRKRKKQKAPETEAVDL